MAKVSIEFDTSNKELEVKFDGKTVPNVQSVSLSKMGYYADSGNEEEFGLSLLTLDKQDDQGYKTYTQIIAKNSTAGQKAIAEGAGTYSNHAEFVAKHDVDSLSKEISAYFQSRKRK